MTVTSALRALSATASSGTLLFLAGCGGPVADAVHATANAARPTPAVSTPYVKPIPPLWSPAPSPTCRDSGVLLSAGPADAAMGLRVQTVTLTNCGRRMLRISGYPGVRLLDEGGEPLKVKIDRGAQQITTAVEDPGPKALTVRPGRSARFGLVWRNTYDDISRPPAVGATVIVTVSPRGPEQRIVLAAPIDLGSTNRLGVTAWEAVKN